MLKSKNTLLSALIIFCALLFSFAPAGDEFSKRYKAFFGCTYSDNAVSYTHLDVYKRQLVGSLDGGIAYRLGMTKKEIL